MLVLNLVFVVKSKGPYYIGDIKQMPSRRKAVHDMKLSGPLMILLLQQQFNLLETPLILIGRSRAW